MNGLDRIRVPEKELRADIEELIQKTWIEWCINALKEYDDSIYQGIIRGVVRLDSKELKGYKCFVQKRLIKKDKFIEVLGRLIQDNDVEVITAGRGGPLLVMGSNYIKEKGLKLDHHSVLVYATTMVPVLVRYVDDVVNEIKSK